MKRLLAISLCTLMTGPASAQSEQWSADVETILTTFESSIAQQDYETFLMENEHPEVLAMAAGMLGFTVDEYRAYLLDTIEASNQVYEFSDLQIDRAGAVYGVTDGQPWARFDYQLDTTQQSNSGETVRTFCNGLLVYQDSNETYVSRLEAGVLYDLFAMAKPDLAAVVGAPSSVCPG